MSFFSWLRNRTSNRTTPGRAQHRPAAPRFRPQLEALEGRDVPSTLTVTNGLDGGTGSLRGEIDAAQNGDTIVFDPSLAGQYIYLTSGRSLLIYQSLLTIQGLPNNPVIDGDYSRVFDVRAGASATLTNLTITGGTGIADAYSFDDTTGGFGGGIRNLGTLTLSGCTVSGNTTGIRAPGFGGGIYNAGTLTVSGCTLSHNSAQYGGGIYNNSNATATVTASTLSGNTAQVSGGGIYNWGRGKLAIGGSLFSNNAPDNVFGKYTDKKGNTFL
jgi:hypothetical protein